MIRRLPILLSVLFPLFFTAPAAHAGGTQDPWAVPAATPVPVRVSHPRSAASGGGALGLGVAVGSPTGLAGKYKLAAKSSIDAALAYDNNLYLHSDYLYEGRPLFPPQTVRLTWFAGAGGRLVFAQNGGAGGGLTIGAMSASGATLHKGNPHAGTPQAGTSGGGGSGTLSGNVGLGARVPAGLELRFRKAPRLEVFGEAALDVGVVGMSGYGIDGALGGRWFF